MTRSVVAPTRLQISRPGLVSPPSSLLLTADDSLRELASFTARVCYTLWHANAEKSSSTEQRPTPRMAYYATPESFQQLILRTLHPQLSPHIATVALLYVQRYVARQTKMNTLIRDNPRPAAGSEARVWCVALSLAIKQHDDRAAAARMWSPACVEKATLGGMSALELAQMEREFLRGMDWQLRITPEGYWGWLQRLKHFKKVMEAVSPVSSRTPSPTSFSSSLSASTSPTSSPSTPSDDFTVIKDDRKRSFALAAEGLAVEGRSVMSINSLVSTSPPTFSPPRKKSMTASTTITANSNILSSK